MSRFNLILTIIWFSIRCKQGANPDISQVMIVFSPQPLEKWFFFILSFVKVTPPMKSQNTKLRNCCNGFQKMMMFYFKTIIASQICGNSFVGFYTTCCCRHMASLGLNGLSEAMGSHGPWARSYLSMLNSHGTAGWKHPFSYKSVVNMVCK